MPEWGRSKGRDLIPWRVSVGYVWRVGRMRRVRWRSLPGIGDKGDGGGEVWISSDGRSLMVLAAAAATAALDFVVLILSVDVDGVLTLLSFFNSSIEAPTPAGHLPLIQPEWIAAAKGSESSV